MIVKGSLDGARYEVRVDSGGVTGSTMVSRLVEQYAGRKVMSGPTGPMVTVDAADPRSVLALLAAKTKVLEATGVESEGTTVPGKVR